MLRPRAHALALALLASTACERPAAPLPAGRISAGLALDDRDSVVVVTDLAREAPAIAVVDERGAPRWVGPLPPGDFKDLGSPHILTSTPDLVLLAGTDLRAHDRTTGALRWRRPGPAEGYAHGAVFTDGRLFHAAHDSLAALDPATGAALWTVDGPELTAVDYLAHDHVARVTLVYRTIHEDGSESPDPGVRERLELVHGPTGALVLNKELLAHCTIAGQLVGVTRERGLLALDLAATPVRVRDVAPAGALDIPTSAQFLGCNLHAGQWRLHHEVAGDAALLHTVDPTTGAVRRAGLCRAVATAGRTVIARGHAEQQDIKAYDLERGRVVWAQDTAIHKPLYTASQVVGDLVYLTSEHEPEKVQHVLAYDPEADEILGAVALLGARPFVAGDGDHRVFSDRYGPRGGAALAVLGRRDLRPLHPPPAGLDVVDTTAEARAGRKRPDTDLVFTPTWDVAQIPDIGLDSPCHHRRLGDADTGER